MADGDHIGLPSVEGLSSHWDAVNDSSPDDALTYVNTYPNNSGYTYDLYHMEHPIPTITQVHIINSVKVYFRISTRFAQTGYAYPILKLCGTEYNGSIVTHSVSGWTTYSQTWTTHPGSGQPWRWQDIIAFQAGIAMECLASGYSLGCTQLYIEVDYDSSAAFPISSVIFRPTGAGDVTNLDYSTPDNHWDAVDDASPDDASTYVHGNTPGTYKYDLYGIDTGSFNPCRIMAIMFTFRISTNLDNVGYAKPAIKLDGVTYLGYEVYHISSAWTTFSSFVWSINPSTGNPWTWNDIRTMQIGIALKSINSGYPIKCTQVYATVYYYPTAGRPRAQIIGLW
jgi:hypothetical protein